MLRISLKGKDRAIMKIKKLPSLLVACTLLLFQSFASAMEQPTNQEAVTAVPHYSISTASITSLLSEKQYELIVQTYEGLTGLHGAPGTSIDWEASIAQYIEDHPKALIINPLTLTSPLTSAYYYAQVFPATSFPNRAALLFTLLELISTEKLSLHHTPVVATYEPDRLRFLREIQEQLKLK